MRCVMCFSKRSLMTSSMSLLGSGGSISSYLELVPGARTWSPYLEPVPGARTWSPYLEPVLNRLRDMTPKVDSSKVIIRQVTRYDAKS
jgi:hypothetical protein